jgi:[NiFe] hydrogenase diaphorase moiety large subunit
MEEFPFTAVRALSCVFRGFWGSFHQIPDSILSFKGFLMPTSSHAQARSVPLDRPGSQLNSLQDEIDELIDQLGKERDALIPILQEIKRRHSVISGAAMQCVADRLSLSPAEVYGVVSFYSFLNEKYHGRFVIRLCRTISCDMAGKDAVARQLQNDLGIVFGETTPDGKFSLEWANCVGMCDQGPAILVNEQVFSRVTPEIVHEIIEACEKVYENAPTLCKKGHNHAK